MGLRSTSYSALSLPDAAERIALDGLALRPFRDADVPLLLDAFADEAMLRWNPGPDTADGVGEWLRHRNDWSSGDHASWAIAGPDDELAGSVSLHHLDWEQRDAEIGYWVAPWTRRRGFGLRGVTAAIRYAFDRIGMHRVYLYHDVANEPSCRLATALGTRLEGRLRASYRNADGGYHDEHLHALLQQEWQAATP